MTIFGESHGPSVGVVIDGCPAGLPLSEDDFTEDLERRKGGLQKGTTPRQEDDKPVFLSGLFNGKTTGAPLTIVFENKNIRSSDYEKQREIPRPGHADFVARQKFGGFEDYRGGGHFSGRLTVCLVAAGVVAKKLIAPLIPQGGSGRPQALPGETPEKHLGEGNFEYSTADPSTYGLLKEFVREHRSNPTLAEGVLWQLLRGKQLSGYKFRRQHIIGNYIADFVCLGSKLVIEVDGLIHQLPQNMSNDDERTSLLQQKDFTVLRFTNEQVINNAEEVLQTILHTIKHKNSLLPSSKSGAGVLDNPPMGGGGAIEASILEIGGHPDINAGLQKAIDAKDSIGGIIECRVRNLPVGLGQPFFDSVESVLAHAVFSIPAVKGIEFGAGFAAAKMFGSQHNDPIEDATGTTTTNHAGGVVAGLTNGNDLVFRVVVKPTSSTPKEQQSWNWETSQVEEFSVKGRHDLCIALRVPPVLEAVTAIVLADLLLIDQQITYPLFSPGL